MNSSPINEADTSHLKTSTQNEDKLIISSRFVKSGPDDSQTPSTIYIWGNFIDERLEGPIIIKELFSFTIRSVAIGNTHILFLTHTGELFSYGEGFDGQLGLGHHQTVANTPQLINIPNTIKEIACGHSHSIALTHDGQVYIWGSGETIGEEWSNSHYTPILMSYFTHYKIVCVAIYSYNLTSIIASSDGNVYAFGNYFTHNFYRTPTHLFKLDEIDNSIRQIALGHMFGIILTNSGTIYIWGDGTYGELSSIHRTLINTQHCGWAERPCKLPLFSFTGEPLPLIINISVGYRHILLLGNNGRVFAFGNNNCGQCASKETERSVTMPMPIQYFGSSPHAVKIMSGKYHSACITSNGQLYTWGHSGGHKLITTYYSDKHLSQMCKLGTSKRSGIHSCIPKAHLIYSLVNERVSVASLGEDCTVVVVGTGQTHNN